MIEVTSQITFSILAEVTAGYEDLFVIYDKHYKVMILTLISLTYDLNVSPGAQLLSSSSSSSSSQ